MQREELIYTRPAELQATTPAEVRGLQRDEVRLLVSDGQGHRHARFCELGEFLTPGDLLVVNRSATLPASLPAVGDVGAFRLNLSTRYAPNLWLAEPRWSYDRPGPLPLEQGECITVAGMEARLVAPHPELPRLWFVRFAGPVGALLRRSGEPIRYGYVGERYPLAMYQTVFASVPGSAEMPSAGRPFTVRLVNDLRRRGVEFASILLHTGVSSLEVETDTLEQHPMYAEPFVVPPRTAERVSAARQAGRRVIAVGTTVVRALESAWDGETVQARKGFTRRFIHPAAGVHVVDGLISGFHDPLASHLAMLYAVAGKERVQAGYAEAVRAGYLWHEFGDSHLLLAEKNG